MRLLPWALAAAMLVATALAGDRASAQPPGVEVEIKASEEVGAPIVERVQLYSASYALVIGLDDYVGGWPRLSNAVKDAEAIAAELRRHGFEVILKRNLDGEDLDRTLKEFFVGQGDDPNARLFLWYAGHGHTDGGEGFLVPVDAPLPQQTRQFRLTALSMRRFGEYARLARAKHAYAVFDSCFAGTIFTTSRALPPRAITNAVKLSVRQFLTSGDADQTVFDNGTFRELFIRALRGEDGADANGDGFVTASEIGLYLSDRVTNLTRTRQTPRYGKLLDKDYDRGDFVFSALDNQPRPAGPIAPKLGGFNLDDLAKEQERQAGWDRWQQQMRAAFGATDQFSGSPALKRQAWDRFLSAFQQDNPFSTEDEALRARATALRAAVTDYVVVTPAPTPSAPPAPAATVASSGVRAGVVPPEGTASDMGGVPSPPAAAQGPQRQAAIVPAPPPPSFPKPPTGGERVVDAAGVLSAAERAELTSLIKSRRTAVDPLYVVTVASLAGSDGEAFADGLLAAWQQEAGQRKPGLLLLLVPGEGRAAIRVDAAKRAALAEAERRRIVDAELLPTLRAKGAAVAIASAIGAILHAAGEAAPVQAAPPAKPTAAPAPAAARGGSADAGEAPAGRGSQAASQRCQEIMIRAQIGEVSPRELEECRR